MKAIRNFFGLEAAGTTIRTEVLGGVATFLTMAYIFFVNPSIIIAAIPGVGPELYQQFFGAIMVATIVAASSATLIMSLWANYPFALAPGMGLNAYFTYTVCLKMGIDWRVALGAVFVEGIIFGVITLVGVRAFIVRALPKSVKFATGAGIGLFLAFIGLKNSNIIAADSNTFVTLGNIHSPEAITAMVGLLIITSFFALKIPGSILLGILIATGLGAFLGITKFHGIIGPIPDVSSTFMQLKLSWADLLTPTFWVVVMTFFFADFFDTAGTLTGLSTSAGLTDKDGNLPRSDRAFMSDAVGTVLGAIFGTSAVTAYIESGAGIAQGARTGLASLVCAILMLLTLFFSPLASSIPGAATAPALIFIGALMMVHLKDINWEDITDALPAFITVVAMPLTFSIANGIALGILSYAAIKLVSGRFREVHWMTYVLAVLFALYFTYFH